MNKDKHTQGRQFVHLLPSVQVDTICFERVLLYPGMGASTPSIPGVEMPMARLYPRVQRESLCTPRAPPPCYTGLANEI